VVMVVTAMEVKIMAVSMVVVEESLYHPRLH
jgi:hypothetical protein